MSTSLRHILSHLSRNGLRKSVNYSRLRLYEAWHHWRRGIRDRKYIDIRAFGPYQEECHPHSAVFYTDFREIMRHIPIRPGHDVLLDYGCGKGVALRFAADYPFRKVMGIEIVPELAEIARDLLRRSTSRTRCRNHEVLVADASTWEVPDEVTVAFMYNPFGHQTVRAAIQKIRESLKRTPRQFHLVLKAMPQERALAFAGVDWRLVAEPASCTGQQCQVYRC